MDWGEYGSCHKVDEGSKCSGVTWGLEIFSDGESCK